MKFELKTIDTLGRLERGRSRHRPRDDQSLYNGKFPFIQTGDVKKAQLYLTFYSQTYNEKGLAQSKLWEKGTLCITIAANIADTAILAFDACFPDSILGFKPYAKESDTKFIKYCFDTYKETFKAISKGTTQDNLSLDKLRSIRFQVPPIIIQRKIAAVLSAYDDLIENNNRRIAILEKMAEELYREWFVRLRFPGHEHVKIVKGVPEGWKIQKLPEVADITYGFPFNASRFNSLGQGMSIIRIRNIPESSTTDFTDEKVDKKYIIRKGDLLVGMDGEFHVNHWYSEDALLVQRSCRIKAKTPMLDGYLAKAVYPSIKYYEAILQGATVGHLGAKHLNGIEILIPSGKVDISIFNTLLSQKVKVASSSQCLKSSRDRLLSRLMSGAIDVENLDIEFPKSMQEEAIDA